MNALINALYGTSKNIISRVRRPIKLSSKGFTLLELMIALSIFLMIWAGPSHLLLQMKGLLKDILRQKESSIAVDITRRFEKDVYTLLKKIEGHSEKIVFSSSFGDVAYEFDGKSIYRKFLSDERLVLKNVRQNRWRFLSQGRWFEVWDRDDLPDAILWEFQVENDFSQMMCPIRFEK